MWYAYLQHICMRDKITNPRYIYIYIIHYYAECSMEPVDNNRLEKRTKNTPRTTVGLIVLKLFACDGLDGKPTVVRGISPTTYWTRCPNDFCPVGGAGDFCVRHGFVRNSLRGRFVERVTCMILMCRCAGHKSIM